MTGTIINAGAIIAGGIAGLTVARQIPFRYQTWIKHLLGVFTVYIGLSMTWAGLNGTWVQISKQMLIILVSLMLGKATGRLLRLQQLGNRLGQLARQAMSRTPENRSWDDGFITGSVLFCVAPLAILGALQNGLAGSCRPLVIKAIMDGLTTLAFARTLGWSVMMSAIPVLAYQGTLTLLAQMAEPVLHQYTLLDSVIATDGLLVFCVSLVILELKRIELADYLPSLAYAPLLTWLWR